MYLYTNISLKIKKIMHSSLNYHKLLSIIVISFSEICHFFCKLTIFKENKYYQD